MNFKSLFDNKNVSKLENNLFLLDGICYHMCIKCKGSGNVAWGKCYDCDGHGIDYKESEVNYLERIQSMENKFEEYKNSSQYLEDEKQETFTTLVVVLQNHKNATEWESNFAYNLNCWKYDKLSNKQKEILFKLSGKYHTDEQQLTFKNIFVN